MTMNTPDYEFVERAIRYLDHNARRQPGLQELAAAVGASESHLQRIFTRWAGISPKRFLQYLTHEHARRLLQESRSVLDAAYESGLSSAGRIHDLFVTVEAVTPGEVRAAGAGLEIGYGVHPTPFGDCLIAATPRGICHLAFIQSGDPSHEIGRLHDEWREATVREASNATAEIVTRVFAASWRPGPIPVFLKGTNFQLSVWKALLEIPEGAVASYDDLAHIARVPGAQRAVGNAVGANPVAYLIPCHRIIRKTGEFGNYGGGPARKKAMLVWESARREAAEAVPA